MPDANVLEQGDKIRGHYPARTPRPKLILKSSFPKLILSGIEPGSYTSAHSAKHLPPRLSCCTSDDIILKITFFYHYHTSYLT